MDAFLGLTLLLFHAAGGQSTIDCVLVFDDFFLCLLAPVRVFDVLMVFGVLVALRLFPWMTILSMCCHLWCCVVRSMRLLWVLRYRKRHDRCFWGLLRDRGYFYRLYCIAY